MDCWIFPQSWLFSWWTWCRPVARRGTWWREDQEKVHSPTDLINWRRSPSPSKRTFCFCTASQTGPASECSWRPEPPCHWWWTWWWPGCSPEPAFYLRQTSRSQTDGSYKSHARGIQTLQLFWCVSCWCSTNRAPGSHQTAEAPRLWCSSLVGRGPRPRQSPPLHPNSCHRWGKGLGHKVKTPSSSTQSQWKLITLQHCTAAVWPGPAPGVFSSKMSN